MQALQARLASTLHRKTDGKARGVDDEIRAIRASVMEARSSFLHNLRDRLTMQSFALCSPNVQVPSYSHRVNALKTPGYVILAKLYATRGAWTEEHWMADCGNESERLEPTSTARLFLKPTFHHALEGWEEHVLVVLELGYP